MMKRAIGVPCWALFLVLIAGSARAQAPSKIVLDSPADAATGVSTTPTLKWFEDDLADDYTLDVATDNGFSTIVFTESGIVDTLKVLSSELVNGTVHYWRVRGSNGSGDGPYSDTFSFTTIVAKPGAPNLTSPADNATAVSITPTLMWDAVSGADTYTVDLDTDLGFGSIDQTQTSGSNSFSPSSLSKGTQYYWRVKATNAGGDSGFSSRTFTTAYDPPGAPTLTSPANAATDVALKPLLDWSAASGTVSSYRLDVSADGFSSFAISDSSITGGTTDFTPLSNLGTSTAYSWRVRAKNPDGVTGPWSTTRTFTTVPPAPAAPTLTSPADAATAVSTTPMLMWNTVSGADSYTVDLDTDPGFGSIDQTQTSASNSFSPSSLSKGTQYHWRVKATNAGGDSGFSSRSFTTMYDPPGKPTLTSPTDNATDVALTPTFMWTAGTGTSFFYRIDISDQSNFSTLLISDTTVSASYTPGSPLATDTQYFWRVRGDNDGGPGDFSTKFKFTTVPEPPGQVTLTSPANGAVEVSLTPSLDWGNVSGADSYHLQVSTAPDFSTTVVDESGIAPSNYTLLSALAAGTLHYWHVKAVNTGGEGAYSTSRTFTTVTSKKVVLSSPSNGATMVSLTPTLSWNTVVGATSYRVQVSLSADMSSPVIDQSGVSPTSLGVGPLDPSTIYHWRVLADNADPSLWSDVWSFATGVGAPGAISLVLPADDATGVAVKPTFKWLTESVADSYQLDVSTGAAFSTTVFTQSSITDTSLTLVSSLSNNTEYFWRVRGTNGNGTGPYSTVFSFTTAQAAPGSPTLVSPANGAEGVSATPTFEWNAVVAGLAKTFDGKTGADTYDLQVATDGNFNTVVVSKTELTGTTYDQTTALANGVQYFWRVRGVNTAGNGPWSAVSNFTTIAGGPQQVTLSSPSNGATEVDLSPVLIWNAVSGAATYQVQLSKQSNFQSLVLNLNAVGGTQTQLTSLDGSTQYYWHVRATNTGAENWSQTWSFTTGSGTPEIVTLVSPGDGSTQTPVDVTLSWNQAPKADSYDLQVATDVAFENLVVDETGLTGTSLMMDNLVFGEVYTWHVRGRNSAAEGPWSSNRGFQTVRGGDQQVLLISPEGGSTGIPLETELVWHSVDGAASYHVQVATSFAFVAGSIAFEASAHPDTVFQLTGLSPDTTYAWRVLASNAGVSNWSITASFLTGKGVPAQVILESPLNDAVDVDLEPELIWTVPIRATSFNLQVALDADFSTVLMSETGLTDVTFMVPELDPATDYFWRVQGVNQDGEGEWSEVRKFTTVGVLAPAAPVLISPLNGAAEVSYKPLFSWNASEGATSYKLEVATNASFTTVTVAVVVAQPFFQSSALALGKGYFWRVEGRNAGGSAVSDVWSFTTVLTTDSEDDVIPADFSLSQNYPNPFNPSTSIEFAMPRAGKALLVIYNIRGEEVARLVDGFTPAGTHTVQWNAGLLPSGIYLYRFQADDFTDVRKLTLTK